MMDATALLEPIRRLHAGIRDAVVAACERSEAETLAAHGLTTTVEPPGM